MSFFKNLIKKVEDSSEFKKWCKKNKNYFLLGFFCMSDTKKDFLDPKNWAVDFFSMDNNMVASFKESGFEESEFLDKKTVATPFDFKEEILSPDEIIKTSKIAKFSKIICVIREDDKKTANLKFVVVPLKLISVVIDLDNKEIISKKEDSLLDLKKEML